MKVMNDLTDRIARFENMATADPTNDMAHFSLGSAYFDAGRYEEAANSFETCIEVLTDSAEPHNNKYYKNPYHSNVNL